ncbi:SUKH-4 family immunity protein [Streptomyces sp. JB150]|uniref:SUKH-4 family immunity protein n=1 Tax=Streptomyces sp. JB150 TaxID=2714844 RepID=UPI00140DDEF2|nr:SUKH-4 family immunity protein [Streptomyces sp. JB150]QIJ63156.1 hypothetical protein G7Z13_14765 [Streptomyces sp. JB150]
MVTFAQAQERAEEWINGDVPAYQHREVRVREFDLGFVVWAEDRPDGPRSDGGGQRLVIARDSGEATLWPSLPVGEVIRRYEEEYGRAESAGEAAPAPAARVDLNQTSFLLSPPEWLQEAADKLGIPDQRGARGGTAEGADSSGSVAAGEAGAGSAGSAGSAGTGPVDAEPVDAEPRDAVPGFAAPAPGSALPQTQAGIPAGAAAQGAPGAPGAVPGAPAGATPWAGTDTNADAGEDRSVPLPETVFAPPLSGADDEPPPAAPSVVPDAKTALMSGGSQLPPTAIAPAIEDPQAQGAQAGQAGPGVPGGPGAQAGPGGSGAPSAPGVPPAPGAHHTPPPAPSAPPAPPVPGAPVPGAPQGSTPPPAAPPVPPAPQGSTPPPPSYGYPPQAGDIADAATGKAAPPPRRGRGATPPPPPGAPGTPGVRPGATPPPPGGTPAGGAYAPTQLVSALGPDAPAGPGAPGAPTPPGPPGAPNTPGGTPPGGVHHAATMLADPSRMGPGAPQPPGAPGAPRTPGAPGAPGAPGGQGGVHHAETMLAGPPVGGPGVPPPPQAPGVPGMPPGAPGVPGVPGVAGAPQPVPPVPGGPLPGQPVPGQPVPGQPMPGQVPGVQPPAYGYPQQQGLPTVGPGYQAVLRYRAQDGSEQQLIRRSAPGTPHPEWQIFHELRAMNVPPDQVLELHTELESCELPGAYCARMIREQWPQARITSIAPYGTDHASRQQGMRQLLAHQGELHQVADGPARPAPVRVPVPPVPPAPPIPPEGVAHEVAAAFGPGVFRFEQAAVSRQGVPPIVAHTLVVAGLPVDMGPFFWAQAQPGRPVPTLAELAQERGVQPAADAGSYLVMGTDFGKAICVQYGTANIVAVPVEAGPGGAPVPPQFVNTGLPEFARCLALLGRMWRLRFGLNQEQAGRWTVDFQAQLAALDPAALGSPESWWSVLLEQMWDGLL